MSGSFAWVYICILDRAHSLFPFADLDPRPTGLALKPFGPTKELKPPTINIFVEVIYSLP
jgi:hypothetical protein